MYAFPEAASRAIVQFLEVNQSEETSRGWMLLTTINLLASSGQVGRREGVVFNRPCVLAPIPFDTPAMRIVFGLKTFLPLPTSCLY